MKKIHIILIVTAIVFISIKSFKFLQKTASIRGVAYIQINRNKVRPIKDMTVFLIKGEIEYEMERIQKDYRNNVSPIEEEVKILKRKLRRMEKALAEQTALVILQKKVDALWGEPKDDEFD